MHQIANWIHRVLDSGGDKQLCAAIRTEVDEVCQSFPIYDWRLNNMQEIS